MFSHYEAQDSISVRGFGDNTAQIFFSYNVKKPREGKQLTPDHSSSRNEVRNQDYHS